MIQSRCFFLKAVPSTFGRALCGAGLFWLASTHQVAHAQQPDPPKSLSDQVKEMAAKPYSMTRYKISDSGYYISSPTPLSVYKSVDEKNKTITFTFVPVNQNVILAFGGFNSPVNILHGDLVMIDTSLLKKDVTDSSFAELAVKYIYNQCAEGAKNSSTPFSKSTISPLGKVNTFFTKNPEFPKVLFSGFNLKTDSIKNGSAITEVQVAYAIAGSKIKDKKRFIFSLTLSDNRAVYALGHTDFNSNTVDELLNKIVNSLTTKASDK